MLSVKSIKTKRIKRMDEIIFRIAEENSNVRLDTFISQNTDFSRNSVQMLIDENRISVNGRPEKKNYKTRLNDEITVSVPPLRDVDILPENIPLDIYYEDEYLLVVNTCLCAIKTRSAAPSTI